MNDTLPNPAEKLNSYITDREWDEIHALLLEPDFLDYLTENDGYAPIPAIEELEISGMLDGEPCCY